MKTLDKRLSILSSPEVQDIYSVPTFNNREREHFFSFTDEELAVVKSLHSHRARVHFLLILGYIKFKPVCLVYQWNEIETDYKYISHRYYSSASKKKQNISRFTRSRLYKKALDFIHYQRYDKSVERELICKPEEQAKYYIDETQLFHDAVTTLKSLQVALPSYSTMQKILSKVITHEEYRLAEIISRHPSDKSLILRLIEDEAKNWQLSQLKKLPKANKFGKFIAISAKADIAGALLLTTVEMLCSKTNASNGYQALDKLNESVIATDALVKCIDSRASVDPKFNELLIKRLEIEINMKNNELKQLRILLFLSVRESAELIGNCGVRCWQRWEGGTRGFNDNIVESMQALAVLCQQRLKTKFDENDPNYRYFETFKDYKAAGGRGNEIRWRMAQSIAAQLFSEKIATAWISEQKK